MPTFTPTVDTDDGLYEVVGETGNTATTDVLLDTTTDDYIFLRCPVHTVFNADNIALDPATYSALVIELTVSVNGGGGIGTFNVYYLPVPAPLTGTNPTATGGLKYHDIESSIYLAGSLTVNPGSFIASTTYSVPISVAGLSQVYPVYRQDSYNGFLSFLIAYNLTAGAAPNIGLIGNGASVAAPSINTTELPFVTGKSGLGGKWSRVDRCGKCGFLMLREKMIEDDWSKGLYVCPPCFDVEEPHEITIPSDRPPIND